MFFNLILLFTIIPAIELILLIKVGQFIGAINTLFFIVSTGVLGAYLARYQGFQTLQKIQDSLNRGIMPTEEMVDGMMIFAGGVLLLTPGFLTDAFGFILLIPITRNFLKMVVRKKMSSMINSDTIIEDSSISQRDDIDDAEFYE